MWPVRAVKNIKTSSRQSCKYRASSIKYTTIIVHNYKSNDIDFVPYTQHPKYASQKSQNPPPEPWPLPDFEPLFIENENTYGKPNLPSNINNSDPLQLFKLFFTDEIMDQLIQYTNRNAELHQTSKNKTLKRRPRK